jgi:hypothetical protein
MTTTAEAELRDRVLSSMRDEFKSGPGTWGAHEVDSSASLPGGRQNPT